MSLLISGGRSIRPASARTTILVPLLLFFVLTAGCTTRVTALHTSLATASSSISSPTLPVTGASAGTSGGSSTSGSVSGSASGSSATFNPAIDVGQDFTTATSWDTSIWTNQYGTGYWFSQSIDGVLLSMASNTSPAWQTTAFMETPNGCANGFGYGTFHYRAGIPASNADQGPGVNLILWRMDNDWIDPALGNIITEDDLMEAWSSNGTGTATLHYYDSTQANGTTDGQMQTKLFDVTGLHDYDEVWAAGSMTLYKDGVQMRQLTGSQVPKDYADGGCNYSLGAQVTNQVTQTGFPTVQLWIANAWHSTSTSAPAP